MGDANRNIRLLSGEQYRVNTYGDNTFNVEKATLARAGFYYTQKGNILKCFTCDLEIDAAEISPSVNVIHLHKEKRPECKFAQTLILAQNGIRTKVFASYDSLRFEKERLETFIDWPVDWLKPYDLAHDGFYYLRTADHCACVFCRGIVGAWEEGDTPRGEHQRHFPHCPFIRGQPVGNIPLAQSEILSKLNPSTATTATIQKPKKAMSIDVCGTPKHMPGSYAESSGPPKKGTMNFEGMGLPQHSGPKRKDFLTYDSRVASFVRWPELVKQKPEELAEAGFFYCGLSDHVRCFHCGNGLRNWESDDQPWNEHARWYPDCSFVILKKGQEFIDKVQRERPQYLRSQPYAKTVRANTPSSSATPARTIVSENELDHLMELDIIRAVVAMGFPQDKVRAALRRKLEQTGLPFFSLEPCIEAVLQYMEEETRLTLQEASSQEIESEATSLQAAKMQALQPENQRQTSPTTSQSNTTVVSSSASTSSSTSSTPAVTTTTSTSSVSSSSTVTSVTPVPTSNSSSPASTSASSAPISTVSSLSSSASNTRSVPPPQQTSGTPILSTSSGRNPSVSQLSPETRAEDMEIDEPANTEILTQPMDVMTEADEIIGIAEVALKPPTKGPLLDKIEKRNEQASGEKIMEGPTTSRYNKKLITSNQSSKELVEELERIHDIRTCKVCMDAEMDVVFLPCQHMVTCSSCALALAECPICREDIRYTIKPILS